MNDQVIGVTIKGIGDFSDVVSNVGSVQKALTKLKLPDKIGDNLNKNISNFMKEYDKYQKKIAEGVHTQGDQNAVNKSLNSMLNSYEKIVKDFSKISAKDFKDIFKLDDGAFASFQNRIKEIQAEIKKIKIDPKQLAIPMNNIKGLTKAKAVSGNGKGLDKIQLGIDEKDFTLMKQGLAEVEAYYERFEAKMSEPKRIAMKEEIDKLKSSIEPASTAMDRFEKETLEVQQQINDLGNRASREMQEAADAFDKTKVGAKSVVEELKKVHQEEFSFNRQATDIGRQIQNYFGLSQMIRKVGDIARDAFATVKELDQAMTQTAVVTNFSVGDMWDMLPTYTAQANQLGSTIKDVYEAATLYYQQGLNTNQAMGLANETLKMARIAGLDAAEATDMMTAALRGFNLEINQMSAQRINDVYSELAAITASDTAEIGSAMERTASIANSANMEFETTSAFLAQMIETTREAPENLGTAMKTIIARFQEMKQDPTKLIDSEGVAMDANKVDKALKTIGVNLMNTKGEFRNLDDVFLDISQRWDSLTQGQQRYIATIAAGSRQQSRFIAMMSNYERTMELVDAANNSAGASQRQFEKTLDSMEAKLNKLKNAWDQFTMGLMNNQLLKFGVDALTKGFTLINKFIDAVGKITPKPFEGITKSILTLVTTLGLLKLGGKGAMGLTTGIFGWAQGDGFVNGFKTGWGTAGSYGVVNKNNFIGPQSTKVVTEQAKIDANAYKAMFQNQLATGGLASAIKTSFQNAGGTIQFANTFDAAFGQFTGGRFAASWTPKIEAELRRVFTEACKNVTPEAFGAQTAQQYVDGLIKQMRSGAVGGQAAIQSIQQTTGKDISKVGVNATNFATITKQSTNFAASISKAGQQLQGFSILLQHTPLAPFGALLSTIGMTLMTFGSTITTVVDTFMIGMGEVVAAEGAAATGTAMLAGGFKALWAAMLESPLLPIIAALLALVAAYKILDKLIVTNKEKMETATEAAASASEAYSSAKQEASELTDAISKIQETDSVFDNLVAGTAEFNEQLVTANEQILALIDKYPMLNDSKYLSTDKNGLMHINEEGLKAVKEYQKQIQARSSAMNLIQTADLNALENEQKIKELRKVKGSMTQEEHEKNLRDADLLQQRIAAETKLARQNAIRTNLVGKEISNQEKLASILVEQYDTKRKTAETEVSSLNKHDIRQRYADYHGYTYDKTSKKIKDIEGNEIDYDDEAIKDEVIEQTVMLDFEANASSLEGILNKIDRDFNHTLGGTFENSANFISDVLSNNIETNEDLLEQILDNPKQLNSFVENLSVKEIAAVLGKSEDVVENNINKYKQELENKLLTNAQNIIDTNAEANGKVAAMLAQAQGQSANAILISKDLQNGLIQQVKNLKSEQRNTLLKVGETLEASVGSGTMSTFVDNLSKIYRSGNEELISTAQQWVDSINWETATGRLKGYNEAIKMTTENTSRLGEEGVKQMNDFGKAMLESKDEANLLGQAFEEFYNSTDFQDMAENMDSFVDSTGKLNAASVMDMSEECHTLNSLLDTGAISAGGVAAALNALGSDGELVLSDLNSRVLELLSNFGQLDDIIASSHRNIENFDWGIDTGEAEDFVKDSAEKWNELYNNGEYGNPQLEAYAKWVLGEDRYIHLLSEKHGDLEETMSEVSKTVNEYSDGFNEAWRGLASGEWKDIELPDNLKDLGISVTFDKNGDWEWDPGKATTAELQQWLQEIKGIGPELAQAMIEDWSNYSPNFRVERQKNDFEAGLTSYVEGRRNADGGVSITASELETISSATGQEIEDITKAVAERAGIDEEQVRVLQNIDENTGEYIMDGAVLNKQLTEAVGAKGQNGWLSQYTVKDSEGNERKNTIDIEAAMAGAVEKGYTAAQAKSMAYESYLNADKQNKDYYYKGELIKAGEYQTLDQFVERLSEIDQNEQWTKVGEAIADGFLNRMDEKENQDKSAKDKTESVNKEKDSNKEVQQKPPGMPSSVWEKYNPNMSMVESKQGRGPNETTWEDKVPGWLAYLIKNKDEGIVNKERKAREEANKEVTGPTREELHANSLFQKMQDAAEAQAKASKEATGPTREELHADSIWTKFFETGEKAATAQAQKSGANTDTTSQGSTTSDKSADNLENGSQSLVDAATQFTASIDSLKTAGDTLKTAGDNLTKAATSIIESNKPKPIETGGGIVAGIAQGVVNNTNSKFTVDNSDAIEPLEEIKTKAEEAKEIINEGATFKLNVSGDTTKLSLAANNAKKITDNAGNKSINVSATASGTDDTNKLTTAVKSFNNLDGHTVKLKANLSGASATEIYSIIGAINDFHLKTDHTVTLKTIKQTVHKDGDATGAHNHGYAPAPSIGSAARGSYGQIGPKGRGGLTLTGELGYEIAWLPDENRSMILGANGPQLVNLPGNAVVWTHEQSKKIVKQKAIPAGSHSTRRDPSKPSAPSTSGGTVSGNDTTKDTRKQEAENAKKAADVIAKAGWVQVWWENMTRRIDATQKKVDDSLSLFEKKIKTFGTTVSSIKGTVDAYKKNLQRTIALNKNEVTQAQYELKRLANGNNFYTKKEVSYEVTKKGEDKDTKETRKMNVLLSNFIHYNKTYGTYEISQQAIDKIALKGWKDGNGVMQPANQSLAQAIKDAAEKEINERNNRLKTAQDNIKKAQEALEKLSNDIYETFYRWEKSVSKVYALSQKLEMLNSKLSISSAKVELQFSKMEAGVTTAATGLSKITDVLETQRTTLDSKAKASEANLKSAKSEFQQSLTVQPYLSKYLKNPDSTEAKNDLLAARKAFTFLDTVNLSGDNFNYDKAIKYLNDQQISKDEYDAIKGVLDGIFEKQKQYSDAQEQSYQSINEIYQTMEEYQSFIADFEKSLLSGIEEQAEQQVKKLDKLNSSLSKAYKDLIDEVKQQLDDRRKTEDNAKTESDIAKKQQRLAALRADTSGGNAIQIAQLEKEIADAQQNYQRSLEDQLIEKLQRQGDEAEKQRQHQIDLLNIQNEIARETGSNLAQVKEWLESSESIQAHYEDIRAAWLSNNGYDKATDNEKIQLEQQFEVEFAKYQGYGAELEKYDTMIGNLQTIEKSVDTIATEISMDRPSYTAGDMKAKGYSATSLKKAGYSAEQLLNAGYAPKDVKGAGYSAAQFAQKFKNDMNKEGANKGAITKDAISKMHQAGYSNDEIAKQFGVLNTMQYLNAGGKTVEGTMGSNHNLNIQTIQGWINSGKYSNLKQTDLAGMQADLTINGKKVTGSVTAGGKYVYANVGSTLYGQALDSKGKLTGKISQTSIGNLTTAYFTGNKKEATEALVYAIMYQKWGSVINKNFKALVSAAGIAGEQYDVEPNNGHWYASVGNDGLIYKNVADGVAKWNPATGKTWVEKYNYKQFLAVAKRNNGASREYAQVLLKKGITKAALQAAGVTQFRTGGLANYTGPAWLDGTPSKPELVLNAQDTKNFIALKDILSKAMSSAGAVSNSYAGDATYEININVDHISSDYDVDKMAERVKKIIVKDSSYRNVTQVRKFR